MQIKKLLSNKRKQVTDCNCKKLHPEEVLFLSWLTADDQYLSTSQILVIQLKDASGGSTIRRLMPK